MTTDDRQNLVELSRIFGATAPLWTQGTGSNLSVKTRVAGRNVLEVKASGFRLRDVRPAAGLAAVDLDWLGEALAPLLRRAPDDAGETSYAEALLAARLDTTGPRPSMEAGMHALFPRKYVAHVHSLVAVLMADVSRTDAGAFEAWQRRASKRTLKIVPPARPGLALTQVLAESTDVDVHLLGCHGMVMQADDPLAFAEWLRLERSFCTAFGFEELDALLLTRPSYDSLRAQYGSVPSQLKLYFPDTAVFLERLRAGLRREGAGFVLREGGADQDVEEIWLATVLLQRARPGLAELPAAIAGTVASLPTERFRRKERA